MSAESDSPPLFPIFLVGASTLLFEILLTRIFSVTMWYHFAFISISLALFGISASGVVLTFRKSPANGKLLRPIAIAVLAFALAVPVAFVLELRIPFLPFDMNLGFRPYLFFLAKFLLLALLFFFSGLAIALSFQSFPGLINRTYFADLTGAGVGCALVVPVLNAMSGPSAIILVSALLFLSAAILFARSDERSLTTFCGSAVLITILFVAANEKWPMLRINKVKSYNPATPQEIERPKIYERWHSVSRVVAHPLSVSGSPQRWFYSKQTPIGFPKVMEVTNDGGARTFIYPIMTKSQARTLFEYDSSDLVYHLVKAPEVLVVGVGGGKDIMSALAFDCRKVTGVELNPWMIDLVQNDQGDFSGRPYNDPHVRIVIDEARNFAARSIDRYDVIKISGTDTWAASSIGAYALVENYLYTREAIRDFFSRLKPGGFLSITRWYPQESLRLAILTAESLRSLGLQHPEKQMAMIRNRSTVTILIKNGPFTSEEVSHLNTAARRASHTIIFVPGFESDGSSNPLDQVHRMMLTEDWRKASEQTGLNLVPPVDDRPFFFSLVTLESARQKKYASSGGFILQHGRALSLLLGLLLISTLVVGIFLIAPLFFSSSRSFGNLNLSKRFGVNLYFLAIGFGYLLVEIPLMQRLILFLGHPVYALTVALFSMLVFSGLGSFVVQSIPVTSRRIYLLLFSAGFVFTAIAACCLPDLLHAQIGLPTVARIAIAVLAVAPIGFLLGIPFPTGLSIVSNIDSKAVSWAWAVNGAASVTAPVLAMIFAIQWGFSFTLYCGAICYAGAAMLFFLVLSKIRSA